MLARELGFIQESIDLNPFGALGVAIGWVLMLGAGLVIRWALIRWKLHGRWRSVEWLLWTALFTLILTSLPLLAYDNSRAWELGYVSRTPTLEYVIDKPVGTPFMAVVFSGLDLLLWTWGLFQPGPDPEGTLYVATLQVASLALAACVSLGLTFGLARLHRLIASSSPAADRGH
jgi:hypothetical protein